MPKKEINEKLKGAHSGTFWSVCANCVEWNWCDNFPFTHIPICYHCWDSLTKLKGVIKKLEMKFRKNGIPDEKLPP